MPHVEPLIGPLAGIIDRLVPDEPARSRARLELLELQGSPELASLQTRLAEAAACDPWTTRARPAFLYVMYAMILCAVPLGVIAAFAPVRAAAIAAAMGAYLHGLPEPLYALFGTGYLGYTAARQWGKAKGTER